MVVDFEEAKITPDGWLCIKPMNLTMVRQWILDRKPKLYTAEIKPKQNRRSLDANAYAWKLMDELAQAVGSTKEEIYRQAVRDVGVYRDYHIQRDEVESFETLWKRQGTAWLTEVVDYAEDGDAVVVRAYFGSSVYSTKQMSRLIDYIVQDCRQVGIETMTPEELARIKEDWKRVKT